MKTDDKTREKIEVTPTQEKERRIASLVLEEKLETERREAYIEPNTRELLRKLLQEKEVEDITPSYFPGRGFVYQTTYLASSSKSSELSLSFLENLSRLGILKRSFYDSVSTCPKCESTLITVHNRCPKCRSHNVDKTSLTEHIPCGYIDQRDKYKQDRCPKCGEELVDGQYKDMGRWYICQDCSERFENPEFDLKCHNCGNNFIFKEAKVIEVPKFSLNTERKKEIRQNVASLENVRAILENLGFLVETPGTAVGQKSGMLHQFSIIAKKQVLDKNITIALDHAVSENEVQASPLILYIYKTSEIKVDIPIFVAMPKLGETAKKIAQGHNILLVEGSSEEQNIVGRVEAEIQSRLQQATAENRVKNTQLEPKAEKVSIFGRIKGLKKKNAREPIGKKATLSRFRSLKILGFQLLCFLITFVSLIGVLFSIGLLGGMYYNNWQLYQPYLINGSMFWLLIASSVVNIASILTLKQIKAVGVYWYNFAIGLALFAISSILLVATTPYSITSLLTENIADFGTNVGRFFLLAGLSLFLLGFPKILTKSSLSKRPLLKGKTIKLLSGLYIALGCFTLYIFLAVGTYLSRFPVTATLSNMLLMVILVSTSCISFGIAIYSLFPRKSEALELDIKEHPLTGQLIG